MHIRNKITDGELFIAGWLAIIFLLFSSLALLVSCMKPTKSGSRCEGACVEKGFHSSRYMAGGRSYPGICECLTEAESKLINTVPTGVRIY